jgi:RES domain-containing protein
VDATRAIGSEWLRSSRSALLRVPSVIVPATHNVLLNPAHPESKPIEITRLLEYPFDVRLKR